MDTDFNSVNYTFTWKPSQLALESIKLHKYECMNTHELFFSPFVEWLMALLLIKMITMFFRYNFRTNRAIHMKFCTMTQIEGQ
jgi:hypothetical protein